MGKKLRSFALPIVASIVGSAILPGIGSALGSTLLPSTLSGIGSAVGAAGANYAQNKDIGQALLAGGGSYVGSQIGGSLGGASPTVGSGLQSVLGPDLGSFIGQSIGSSSFAPISSVIGGTVGSNLASSLSGSAKNISPQGESAAPQFKPTQESEMPTMPNFAGLSPFQQSTNLATQGVYGGGQGPGEQSHFLNLINRRLVDETGKVDKDLSEINPIENSYLSQLGLGDMGNPTSLLEAISKRKKAA